MTAIDPLHESTCVQRWLDATNPSSASPGECASALELVLGLCEYLKTTPDDLVAECLRSTRSGDTAISAKGRRHVEEGIRAYVATLGLAGHQSIATANVLRGFLIHNGIFIQGPASIS